MNIISNIGKIFEVKTNLEKDDIKFYNADNAPFKVYGVFKENGKYRRMPEDIALKVNERVAWLHSNTTGGRVRFITNSSYIAINADMDGMEKAPHFAFTGSIGFDLYAGKDYIQTYIPPYDIENGYEGIIELTKRELREITINFPLYSNVKNLYIGLEEKAIVQEPKPYVNEKPIVYYGSSITQGGCASRPGMSYQNIISREFNCDYINLGFSGAARGEDEIVEYIKGLAMSAFVLDYDHNAPTIEHLERTHEKMFKAIRAAHPELPIIIMSRPNYYLDSFAEKCLPIIKRTYNNAIAGGDKNVYMIDGKKLTELCGNDGTVDNCHPTDFGFVSMSKAIAEVLREISINK